LILCYDCLRGSVVGTLYSRGRNYQPCMLQTVYDERTLSGVFVWIMHKLLLQHPQWCCGEHITRTASPGLGMDLLIRPFLHNLLRNTIFDNFYKKCLICVRTFKKTFTLLGRTMGFNRSQRYEFDQIKHLSHIQYRSLSNWSLSLLRYRLTANSAHLRM